MLAYHYRRGARARRGRRRHRAGATELAPPARRYLALAGERALGLDTAQAETRLDRALELTPVDDPERPGLLLRWADAARQEAGQSREAAAALEEALTAFRARGEREAEARALILLADVTFTLGGGRSLALAADAVICSSRSRPGRRSLPPTRSSPRRISTRASTTSRSPQPIERWRLPNGLA